MNIGMKRMATQFSILLLENNFQAKNLVERLKKQLFDVEYYPSDFVIIAKVNKQMTKTQFLNYCIGLSDVIDSIDCVEIPDFDIEVYKEDFGFKTGLEYINDNK